MPTERIPGAAIHTDRSQPYIIVEYGFAYRLRLYCRESRVRYEVGHRIGHEQCDRKKTSVRAAFGIMRLQCRRICTSRGNIGTFQSAYTYNIYLSIYRIAFNSSWQRTLAMREPLHSKQMWIVNRATVSRIRRAINCRRSLECRGCDDKSKRPRITCFYFSNHNIMHLNFSEVRARVRVPRLHVAHHISNQSIAIAQTIYFGLLFLLVSFVYLES